MKTNKKKPKIIKWRPCPAGQYWRRAHYQSAYRTRRGKVVPGHPVRAGCCQNPSKKDQIYQEELKIIAKKFVDLTGPPAANNLGFRKNGDRYDELIRGWTMFWNDTLHPKVPLNPNIVKALIASESGFNYDPKRNNFARGLMQLTEQTRKALGDIRGELKNHIVHIDERDITNPTLNIAGGVRWLFEKKRLAGITLGRTATWDEAVAEYKDYLNEMVKHPKIIPTGMKKFRGYLKRLNR